MAAEGSDAARTGSDGDLLPFALLFWIPFVLLKLTVRFAVLVLALHLVACSLERLPGILLDIRNPDPRLTPSKERGFRHRLTVQVGDAAAFDPDGVDVDLAQRHRERG